MDQLFMCFATDCGGLLPFYRLDVTCHSLVSRNRSAMRVIAGKYRSRNLQSLPGLDTRPTYDRLKETLFNVLAAAGMLEGKIFVDLFAGTGSIGIEALSRGASRVFFAESGKKPAQVIRANLLALGIGGEAEVYEGKAVEALRALSDSGVQAD